ncbi:uncharacterized protein LOC135470840 [Liolophura sinensis]|uniref:uncharacterized protein LOC135470840 n=1 Tax=Liolophura sinensis TaxID=3198878 RepID=UPI003158A8CA
MDRQTHWFLLGIIASAFVTCRGETCHVQPECSCSKTDGSFIICSSLCGPYIPKFGSSTVQFDKLSVGYSRETTSIRDGTFGELKVKRLYITQTGIDEIGCQAFAGLDLGLETISLHDNYLNNVPNCSLARFKSVTDLNLAHNRIASIPADSFASFTLLQSLRLQLNRIASIEPGAFRGLGKLTTLYLYNNELVYLDASTFMGADSLTTLQLSNNNISSIHVRAFDGLGKLTKLDINVNNLTHLDSTVFDTTGELLYLYMDNNDLTELGNTLFLKSKKLRHFSARNNKIKSISDATFTGLDKLQSLYLDNNWLKDLRQQWFTDTITLNTLRLSRNNITEVNKGTFQTLGNLTDLRLGHNEIRVIEKNVFKGLSKVNTIFLNNNRLMEIRKDTFIHCPEISRIDLSFNIIQDVHQGSFRNLPRLYLIDLSGNRITQIVTGTFSNVSGLTTLSLNDNRVSSISERLFENMEPSLRTLELRNNGWSSSSLIWFAKVMVNLTRLNTLDLSNNPLSTIPTDVLPTLENIDTVKMRNCSIQFITNDSVSIFNYKWDVRENTISTYTSIQDAYIYGNINVSHNLIPALNVDVLDGYRYGGIIADNNKIQNGFTLTLLRSYISRLSISLRNNLIEKGIQISALDVTPSSVRVRIQTLDLSNNKFTKVNLFPVKLLHQLSWNPCNSSFGSQLTVRTLNLSNNAISVISAAACLGSVYTLDLRNNHLEVLGDFLTSPSFRMNNLYLSGNRIHRVSPNAFSGITKYYFTLDLRDNKLVGLENIQPIMEKFQSLRLSLSGNPLVCGCEIDWLRNDSIRQKVDSVRCQTPRSAFRYLAWCFPLTGCQGTLPMSFTEATRKICEMDSNLELSNLSVTASKGVTNVTWTKIGPGVITGFRLEFHPVDEVESRFSFLVHQDVNYAILTNLVEGKTNNICVTAELASQSGGSVVCIQTSLSLVEAFSAGLPLVAGLGSALGVCVIIALLTIICLAYRQSKPNFFQRNRGPVPTPPAISIINGQNLNTYTPNPGYDERESDDNFYEDVKHEEYENTVQAWYQDDGNCLGYVQTDVHSTSAGRFPSRSIPPKRSLVNQLTVRTLNLSNNAISVISAAACLGSVYTLDLRNNRLEVLGDFLTSIKSPGPRINSLYLSGNRLHRVSPNAFDGITKYYFTLDLRDNKLVSLENIQPIIEKFQSLRLSLSGNPLACGCEIDWLRNDSIRQKVDSVRCQTPRSAFRYLAWCFPLTGCQDTMPMRFTAATRKICEMDSNLELSNLSVTASKGVTNVTWTKIGPGVITGFRLELHSVDEVESRNSFLVHQDVNYATLTNLVECKTYNICVTAELASQSGGSTVCMQTSLSVFEDTMPMRFTAATRKICEIDSNLELSNLSVTASKGVTNVTWTKSGPGVITGFRLEFHPVDEEESRNSFLVHQDVNYAILTNLVEGKTYNICVTAELASPSGGSVVCLQTSLSLVEAFSAGLPLVAGLGSALGICVIIALLTIICLTCRQSKPNIFQQNRGPLSTPPAISEINGQNLNAYTPNPGYGERESDGNLYEDVKHEEYENTGFNAQ